MLPDNLAECLQLLEGRHPTSIDLGLERCGAVWRRMGSPAPAPKIFVIAGTNGKGSVVATLCSLLGALGFRHGSYTSPHLVDYNERVRVDSAAVTDDVLLAAFERVEQARGRTSLTYFEFGTLAAIDILEEYALDFAVMEVGLGGRLDAVNLLDADCAVITPIGLDHQEYLGDDIVRIGREKAGIIRPGTPVICSETSPPASVFERARELGAPIKCIGQDFSIEKLGDGARLTREEGVLDLPLPVLGGPHQLNNMAVSIMALLELVPTAATQTAELSRGLENVRLGGRLERISDRPAIWIDVGHNPMAAEAVAEAMDETRADEGLGRVRCVVGMLSDKDAEGVAVELARVVDAWYCAGLDGARGQTGVSLARRVQTATNSESVRVFEHVQQALETAVSESDPSDGILVFGSFLTASQALQWRRSRIKGN